MDHGSSSGGSGLEEKVLIVDIFFIERHLLRLIGHQHVFPPHDTAHEANVRIDVGTAHGGGGSWVVKRRDGNVIVNNRDTISPLFLTIDAALEFRTTRDFWGATGAGISRASPRRGSASALATTSGPRGRQRVSQRRLSFCPACHADMGYDP